MPGTCELHRGMAGRAVENKVCRLTSFSNGQQQQKNQTAGYCSASPSIMPLVSGCRNSGVSTLSYGMSRTLCKLCHKLSNAKKGVGQTFTCSN